MSIPEPVDLGVWCTPLEPAPRLAQRIGLHAGDLWIKRDDWLGMGGGGSKLRKLAFLCARALERGANTLVTGGARQSNYCRLTAAAARRLGLDVVLVLEGDGPADATGNLALNGLFGADIRWAGRVDRRGLGRAITAAATQLRAEGRRPEVLPLGGSDPLAVRGYLGCAEELREQAPDAEHVVVALGSGATMAGLVAGLGAERVLGVDAGAVPDGAARVETLLAEAAAAGLAPPSEHTTLRVDSSQIGGGYEVITAAACHAIDDAAQCAGVILDPVYSAKAFAGLTAAVKCSEIRPGQRTVFVHTGGLPGLFGHPLAAELTAMTAP